MPSPADMPFSDSQLHVLKQTVQAAVKSTRFQQERANKHHDSLPPVRSTGMASPLGLQRSLDRSLEEKILRSPTTANVIAPLLTPPVTPREAPVPQLKQAQWMFPCRLPVPPRVQPLPFSSPPCHTNSRSEDAPKSQVASNPGKK